MDHDADVLEAARFFDLAIAELADMRGRGLRILDFGCGSGVLMRAMTALGHESYGCDIVLYPEVAGSERVKLIEQRPYRIPFESGMFDVVLSTSVLEHTVNTDECYAEIDRVLKPGGCAMHLLPSKWYLPTEPHIFVPLANHLSPYCPTWWLGLWAWLGFHTAEQNGHPWRQILANHRKFMDEGVNYLTTRTHNALSRKHFAAHDWPR